MMNLQKRSVLLIAAILFLAISINTLVLTVFAYSKYKEAVLSQAVSVGSGMKTQVDKVLVLGVALDSVEGLSEKLAELTKDPKFGYAMITDSKGKTLFHSDEAKVGKELNDPATRKTLSADSMMIELSEDHYDIALPLKNPDGGKVGVLRVGLKSEVVTKQLYNLLISALLAAALCFLGFLLVVYFLVAKFMVKPILDMEKVASLISSGVLTEKITTVGKDEIASLGKAINNMADNLRDIIGKIRETSSSISLVISTIKESSGRIINVVEVQKKATAENASSISEMDKSVQAVSLSSISLAESANEASSAVTEMTASISHVAGSASQFNETAEEAASSVEEMIASINEIASSLQSLSSSSDETSSALLEVNATIREIQQSADESVKLAENVSVESSEKGLSAIYAAVKGMDEIKDSVTVLSDVINRLGRRSEEIGNILTVIDEVADQTGLLALNAAILAAQAGEYGNSFSVVAVEIKNLAERTSSSTKEITELIGSVQSETRSSIEMAAAGLKSVDKGMKLVKEVSKALESIQQSSNVSTEMSRAIQRATSEEANVIRHITLSMKNMADQIELIAKATQDQNKGSKMILDAMDKIKDISKQIVLATNEQFLTSKQIASVSENVYTQAEQITTSISSQKQKSNDILHAIGMIQKSMDDLTSSASELDVSIGSLNEDTKVLFSELQKFKV